MSSKLSASASAVEVAWDASDVAVPAASKAAASEDSSSLALDSAVDALCASTPVLAARPITPAARIPTTTESTKTSNPHPQTVFREDFSGGLLMNAEVPSLPAVECSAPAIYPPATPEYEVLGDLPIMATGVPV